MTLDQFKIGSFLNPSQKNFYLTFNLNTDFHAKVKDSVLKCESLQVEFKKIPNDFELAMCLTAAYGEYRG